MSCPSCGNTTFERIDHSILRCTECLSVWNTSIFPDFPETEVGIGEIWDSEEDELNEWYYEEDG